MHTELIRITLNSTEYTYVGMYIYVMCAYSTDIHTYMYRNSGLFTNHGTPLTYTRTLQKLDHGMDYELDNNIHNNRYLSSGMAFNVLYTYTHAHTYTMMITQSTDLVQTLNAEVDGVAE